ncbi:CMGC family protein kinase [Trichomonas vaginalis G3]|uniref:cyclin-dependent kinase n=1 Tax=Trichomonas vaginalis (strain ATCC PRA-98 / G3) TaxID=412133 RepID=A2D9J7_TRIV3|nr:STKc CDK like domain-containing protein [Trichomonas vaginalis G3]EAY22853.1 CMGC family protein kinase [Trichomonas vaginalis G3]KAI5527433.1 STKc CDK like domain-containing protein [Trichomonas vaginalis G3]|eukprot:XP_001583839.1 CMGC family protein kinase [Trichomonas vaginalis G3]
MLSNYERLEKLGEGTYGAVYKARNKTTGEILAMKVIHLEQEEEGIPPTSVRENSILSELSHPNVVSVKEVINTPFSLILIMEYLDKDLKNYLATQHGPINPMLIKSYAYQILAGLSYCHCQGIIHRDMKPQNLLLNRGGFIKLCDFGLARPISLPMRAYTKDVITLWYRAPEILLDAPAYDLSVDVWSVGCIIAEMMNRTPLFPGDSEIDQLYTIFKILGTPTESEWPGVSQFPNYSAEFPKWLKLDLSEKIQTNDQLALDLISKMLQYDPVKRITAKDALDHPYFADLSQQIKDTCRPMEIDSIDA